MLIRPIDSNRNDYFPGSGARRVALRRVLDIEGRWSRGRREERRRKGEESIETRKERETMG